MMIWNLMNLIVLKKKQRRYIDHMEYFIVYCVFIVSNIQILLDETKSLPFYCISVIGDFWRIMNANSFRLLMENINAFF